MSQKNVRHIRYMLHKRPSVYDEIPAGLKPDALELELHKQVQKWEREIKKQSIKLEEAAKRSFQKGRSDPLADMSDAAYIG